LIITGELLAEGRVVIFFTKTWKWEGTEQRDQHLSRASYSDGRMTIEVRKVNPAIDIRPFLPKILRP
jgi:hypothetical protein